MTHCNCYIFSIAQNNQTYIIEYQSQEPSEYDETEGGGGGGAAAAVVVEEAAKPESDPEDDPFMKPIGMNILLPSQEKGGQRKMSSSSSSSSSDGDKELPKVDSPSSPITRPGTV